VQIKRFQSSQFAGLKNISIDLEPGLNVIVGANETGKSSMVNAMYAALFEKISWNKSTTKDKQFIARYMPHPSGDYIDAILHLEAEGQEYIVEKRWGNRNNFKLVMPDGSIVTLEKDAERAIKDLFKLGRKTYESIVFARQSDIKNTLQNLQQDETIHSVKNFLSKAIMELDGISIEKLKKRIDKELDQLLKKWDLLNNRPEGGKGISNPHKRGLGTILDSYYKKETLHKKLEDTWAIEEEIQAISKKMQALQTKSQEIEAQLKRLEPIEEDMIKRAEIEPELKSRQIQLQELKDISLQWPDKVNELARMEERLQILSDRKTALKEEEENQQKYAEKMDLEQRIQAIEKYSLAAKELQKRIDLLPLLTEQNLQQLEQLNETILTSQAAIKAGHLLATVNKKKEVPIWVTRDLEEKTALIETQIQADGYLKLTLGDIAEVEIKAGEFDFNQLKREYEAAHNELQCLLKQFKTSNIDEARSKKRERDTLLRKVDELQQKKEAVLGTFSEEEIRAKIAGLQEVSVPRPKAELEGEKEKIDSELIKVQSAVNSLKDMLSQWQQKYENKEKLYDLTVDLGVDIKQLQLQINNLQELPAEFSNSEAYRSSLKKLREEQAEITSAYNQCIIDYHKAQNQLPSQSCEDIKMEYAMACRDFEKNLLRAQKVIKIHRAFQETMAEMDNNSLQPLAESFNKYLSRATAGNYQEGDLDDNLTITMVKKDNTTMPINLLSAGTYDAVAISLRFSLLEQVFDQGRGFVVLDDCLVDLDPTRKAEVVSIIKDYAANNQVIFTTCNPDIAEMLGGNIIRL